MSNYAILAEGLSKSYRLGELVKYKSLRDSIVGAIQRPFRSLAANGEKKKENMLWALRDVSLEIKDGDIVGLIGRNGAGKSTLLKILSRITEPTSGQACVRGRLGSLLEVGTGFHPELTGRENIYLSGAILGMRKREVDRNFDAIVDFADVERFIETPVKHYSSGMYVRLAFAVAAHLEPEVLLVDEVLAVGDAAFQKKCLGKMGDAARTGRTVVFVSHNMAAIQNLCTRAYMLTGGQVSYTGSVSSVIDKYLAESRDNSQRDLMTRTDRQGNGRLRFTQFSPTSVSCGSSTELVIGFSGAAAMRNVHISVGFYNTFGEGVFYLSNDISNSVFEEIPGQATFVCCMDKFPLMPGSYSVTLYCTVNGVVADWVKDAARIDVEYGDFYGSGKLPPPGYGTVVAPYNWMVR